MNTLPPEILCDIFLKCLPSDYNEHTIPYSVSVSSPLRISHVCRTWRDISLSCRELWSYLCLGLYGFLKQGKREMMVEIFDTWMARTNDGPLNFMISSGVPALASIQDHRSAEHIFAMLIKNQHRWKDVYFDCRDVIFSSEFPGFNLTNTPILTSLILTLDRSLRATADFTQSSQLTTLKIEHGNFDLLTGRGLSRLEYVDLSLIFPNRERHKDNIRHFHLCFNILRNAPSLRSFGFDTDSDPSSTPLILDEEYIPPAGLRDLQLLEENGSLIPVTVVDAMTLPILESFTYKSKVGSENLLRFFQRSVPPLASLKICCPALEGDLISILRLLPGLQHLILGDVELSDSFFHELTVTNDADDDGSAGREQIVCPRLSYFWVHGLQWETDNWSEILFNMAKSRASILGTFKTVSISGKRYDLRTIEVTDISDHIRISDKYNFTLAGT